ncbi:NADP-dependent oxidoreductase [Streptomyces sp. NPDC091272]|uniref:NADP-dependent oxidoreductase n=1 Tax=Streptomyces sp. NPDC091272 TaxID=3365981 RepID=UPI00381114EC
MRAAVFTEADGFGIVTLPVPEPGPGQIRVKVAASDVNNIDVSQSRGNMATHVDPTTNPPEVEMGHPERVGVGVNVAGTVDALGPGVNGPALGTRVAGTRFGSDPRFTELGSHADYVLVSAKDIAPLADSLDFLDAATIPLNALTAADGLAQLDISLGNRVLVTGAAGSAGGYAVSLAAHAGWDVTALARDTDTDFLQRAGAAHAITSLDGQEGFDAVLDAASLNEQTLPVLRDGGTYVAFDLRYPEGLDARNITAHAAYYPRAGHQKLEEVLQLAAEGILEPRRAGIVPLDDATRAYSLLTKGGHRGRWVITP